MAKITWLGEDALHGRADADGKHEDGAGPSWTTWRGYRFDKGKPVEITDNEIIGKAKGNRFFKVEGGPGRPARTIQVGLHATVESNTEATSEPEPEPEAEEPVHEPADPAPRRFRR